MRKFWRSETGIIWLQYFAAGIAMIPAGVMYVVLNASVGEKKAFAVSVFLASVIGLLTKHYVGRSLTSHFASASAQPIAALSNRVEQIAYVRAVWIGSEATTGAHTGAQIFNSLG